MPSNRLKAAFLALLFLISCCFGGCLSAEDEAVLAPAALPDNLDPQLCEGETAAFVVRHLFEGLTVQTPDGIAPGAAESWTVSADGLTYTFTLRPDAGWSDGEPVTADDFVFAFNRLFDPSTGSEAAADYLAISGASERLAGEEVPIGVRAEGEDTVVFTLRAPDREFLSLLSLPAASPCREDFFRETHGRYGLSLGDILGNGRFILSTWDGEYIRLRGRGEDEGTVIRLEPGAEATVYWEEAEAGDYTRVYGILFNQSVPLFSSEAVRQALAADLPESVSRPETALSPGLREGLGTVKLPELAIDAALYRSGSAGNEAEGLTVLIPEDEALSRLFSDVAQLWQRDFGLYLAVETLPEAELMERVEAGDYDCAVLSLPADFAGPGRALETAAALGRVGDEALHSLLSEARQNDGKADSLYTEAEQFLLGSGAFIPLMTASFTLQTGGFPAVSLANGAISFSRG